MSFNVFCIEQDFILLSLISHNATLLCIMLKFVSILCHATSTMSSQTVLCHTQAVYVNLLVEICVIRCHVMRCYITHRQHEYFNLLVEICVIWCHVVLCHIQAARVCQPAGDHLYHAVLCHTQALYVMLLVEICVIWCHVMRRYVTLRQHEYVNLLVAICVIWCHAVLCHTQAARVCQPAGGDLCHFRHVLCSGELRILPDRGTRLQRQAPADCQRSQPRYLLVHHLPLGPGERWPSPTVCAGAVILPRLPSTYSLTYTLLFHSATHCPFAV